VRIQDVIDFAKRHGNGRVYIGWSDEEIAHHLKFHANDGTLMVTESDGAITSFCVYKQIRQFDGDIEKVFWQSSDRSGQDVYLHELVSISGVSAAHMLDVFERSDPRAIDMTYWAHRGGKLKQYTFNQLKRFLCHHRRHHHHQTMPQQTVRA
jgi:hypothetical protein